MSEPSLTPQFWRCPNDGAALRNGPDVFACANGHTFPILDGVPVFIEKPRRELHPGNMARCEIDPASPVDRFVNDWIVNTNGNLYWHLRGRLPRYPIPEWPFLPSKSGSKPILIDLGCGWGRWSIAASQAGFQPIGFDVHLDALQAGTRAALQLDSEARFACSEIDRLPVFDAAADVVFSYSVLQHLERQKVARIVAEAFRVLKTNGELLIQLPNSFGLTSLAQQARRGFREARSNSFEMRYWSPRAMLELARSAGFREASLAVDGFFSQNPQRSDLDMLKPAGRALVRTSIAMREMLRSFPLLARVADSLWLVARK